MRGISRLFDFFHVADFELDALWVVAEKSEEHLHALLARQAHIEDGLIPGKRAGCDTHAVARLQRVEDQPAGGLVCYGMAKAALVQLTKVLAVELGPTGVRANAVAPGFIVTPMTNKAWIAEDGTEDPEIKEAFTGRMSKGTPLRTVGEPDDIAYAVLYLASDASKFMTGQILRPNGGVAMPW